MIKEHILQKNKQKEMHKIKLMSKTDRIGIMLGMIEQHREKQIDSSMISR